MLCFSFHWYCLMQPTNDTCDFLSRAWPSFVPDPNKPNLLPVKGTCITLLLVYLHQTQLATGQRYMYYTVVYLHQTQLATGQRYLYYTVVYLHQTQLATGQRYLYYTVVGLSAPNPTCYRLKVPVLHCWFICTKPNLLPVKGTCITLLFICTKPNLLPVKGTCITLLLVYLHQTQLATSQRYLYYTVVGLSAPNPTCYQLKVPVLHCWFICTKPNLLPVKGTCITLLLVYLHQTQLATS